MSDSYENVFKLHANQVTKYWYSYQRTWVCYHCRTVAGYGEVGYHCRTVAGYGEVCYHCRTVAGYGEVCFHCRTVAWLW